MAAESEFDQRPAAAATRTRIEGRSNLPTLRAFSLSMITASIALILSKIFCRTIA
jgi:hypothetical protein